MKKTNCKPPRPPISKSLSPTTTLVTPTKPASSPADTTSSNPTPTIPSPTDSTTNNVGLGISTSSTIPAITGNLDCLKRSLQWNEGRRIVELSTLANNLSECAANGCNLLQDLRNIVGESRSGFGSVLSIRCSCGVVNKVRTCSTHKSSQGRPIFVVNTKAAVAMIHTGMSLTAMERFS